MNVFNIILVIEILFIHAFNHIKIMFLNKFNNLFQLTYADVLLCDNNYYLKFLLEENL